ncbi:hypothetical protein TNCV_2278821 [Trichonephila clavipes]|uniref:Uncharacterized protein n=1 Tax=Trichonephila clavipes TaxID=2585209 RepID=A0A8X6R969_TRICX|nr:hypothetical protein TNCV_2278821 [Trichonephila clavipes]
MFLGWTFTRRTSLPNYSFHSCSKQFRYIKGAYSSELKWALPRRGLTIAFASKHEYKQKKVQSFNKDFTDENQRSAAINDTVSRGIKTQLEEQDLC